MDLHRLNFLKLNLCLNVRKKMAEFRKWPNLENLIEITDYSHFQPHNAKVSIQWTIN